MPSAKCQGIPQQLWLSSRTPTRQTGWQKVRHLFRKRFVSVLSFWCLTCRKPLNLLWGATSAGIANNFNEIRVLFALNPCTMPQRRNPFDISLSRLVPLSPWYTDGTRRFVFRSRIHWPSFSKIVRAFRVGFKCKPTFRDGKPAACLGHNWN
jgi:hypothetical protein